MSTAHLAAIRQFGDPFVAPLATVPCPQPGRREIVVQVDAAAVNPIDVRRRDGYGKTLFSLMGAARLPLVLGNDFAGTVCAVGPGVKGMREGDAVFGAKPPSTTGTHATHVTVRAEHVCLSPPTVPAAALATLPYNFLTVTRAFSDARICRETVNGRPVLVHGATGGLGLIAVRLLHRLGAVITAVGGTDGLPACLAAGAAEIVDRHQDSLTSLPRHFAATLNFGNWDDEEDLLGLLAAGAAGHATTVHPLLGNFDRMGLLKGAVATLLDKRGKAGMVPKGARYAWTVFRPDPAALQALADCAAQLAPGSMRTFPLTQAERAYQHVLERRPGRAVLLPAQH